MPVQSLQRSFALTNGVKPAIDLPSGFTSTRVSVEYFADEALTTPATPSAGTLLCETADTASGGWRKMRDGRIDCAEPDEYTRPFTDYPAVRVRFTPEDVVGAAYARVTIWQDSAMAADPVDPLVYLGRRALVVQPYTEANIKNGLQFYIRFAWPTADPIAAGTTRYVRARTGSKAVIFKDRELHYVAEEIQLQIYEAPTNPAGGVALDPSNFNRDPAVAQAATMQWWKGTVGSPITYDAVGTALDDEPEYFFGASATGQRSPSTLARGQERILRPNKDFILAFSTPAGVGNSRAQYFGTWYEGDTDLPQL